MSSEMRELIRKEVEQWVGITRNRDIERSARVWMEGYDAALTYCAERISALLALTEAGADGAAMAALERESDKSMGVGFDQWFANPYTAVMLKSIAEDYVPRTHPQDASGDAVAELIAAADVLNTGAKHGLSTYPEDWKRLDAALAAMQAKEAK